MAGNDSRAGPLLYHPRIECAYLVATARERRLSVVETMESFLLCRLRQAFGTECEIREFRWSGNNTHQARLEAGADLAQFD